MVLSISCKNLLNVLCAFIGCLGTENFAMPPVTAQWIWHADKDVTSYNQAIVARKIVSLNVVKHAKINITADSYYRLFINGFWINDGPCRSWPEHFQYDVHDVTPYLHAGENEIKVVARYYGCDFHSVPQQAGLLAQLDIKFDDDKDCSIISDQSWFVARLKPLICYTPRISIQMEPSEVYDARLEDELMFVPAGVLFDAHKGPWSDLNVRDTKLLTLNPTELQNFVDARIVQREMFSSSACVKAVSFIKRVLMSIANSFDFQKNLKKDAVLMLPEKTFVPDGNWQFEHRQVLGDAHQLVKDPEALMYGTQAMTTIVPNPEGDVELLYDLGQQNCGYWSFDLIGDEGTVVDIAAVEYIAHDGRIQHTGISNCLRYITKKGVNSYTSLKRRSGRYIFITLRNQKSPIHIRHFKLIESTYPVTQIGDFKCSDIRLNKIWKICISTLKLCMEDAYTDCPLYEQTTWVGDARNEALVGYSLYGATDIALRTINLASQSLELQPMTACNVPYFTPLIFQNIPAWSFLWNISTWDYYWYTGDKEFLVRLWPSIIRNIQGAADFINEQGLFEAPCRNMFDWSIADQDHNTVLHNSMLLVGALQSAIAEAQLLGYAKELAWLIGLRAKIVAGINKLWNEGKGSYPDSIHYDGSMSDSTCQHTSFLSIIYDIIEQPHLHHAVHNLMDPPHDMVKIGSPFALHYLFEAYEKLGLEQEIIKKILSSYEPMLAAGATSCWETFAEGTISPGGFPTRSHCHGWSTTPGYFLPRIILGIKPLVAGGEIIQISPQICNLTQAKGTVATIHGPVTVSWGLDGDALSVDCTAPAGTELRFLKNHTMESKKVMFNGMQVLERAEEGRVAILLSNALLQQTRRKELAFALASAYHDRLGQSSPVGILPKWMLRDIVRQAEFLEH